MRLAHHLFGLLVAALLAAMLLYMTRFWIFTDWWGNEGLFGISALSPSGDFLAQQLDGTRYRPFILLLWLAGGFLALSAVQAVANRVARLFA